DLWTGKVLWQQPELDSLWDLVPLQNSGRILLLTLKDTKERKTAAIGAAFVPYVGFGTSAVAAAVIPLRLEMISLDPRSGQTEWTSQYSRPILPAWFDATEAGGKIYVSDYDAHGFSILASVDASSGQTLWEYKEPADFRAISAPAPEFNSYDGWWAKDRKLPPPVQFTNGRAVFAAQDQSGLENLQDLDLASQKPVWTAKDLGKIRGLIVDQDLVLVSADDGAFGIAADSGAVRWTFKAQGQATNPVSFKDDNAVFLCDDINFTELDAATGKVLRQTPHHLGSEPDFIRQVDPKFIMAVGKKDAVLLNTATGESSARFPRPDAEFAPTTFWVSWENFDAISDSPPDLQRELRGRWPEISAEAGQSPEVFTWHTRVQSFITSNAGPLYANRLHGDTWRFRCVNPTTGAMHTFDLGGQHPDANSAAGLVYLIEDNNRLRAVQIPAN
ncbi:MAG: PQQ-binding-like beta-propeller repeat protein, partial [Candidatus Acidiferrales bacterium]